MRFAIYLMKKEETKMEKLRRTIPIFCVAVMLLLPAINLAGDLEPSGPPAPTMKTLDQIPPTWSQKLPAAQRFELVLDGEAVLDKETGLVWGKYSTTTPYNWETTYNNCRMTNYGPRKGWRLPTVEELASLLELNLTTGFSSLPSGHPFMDVQNGYYWSSTENLNDSNKAYCVGLKDGHVSYEIPKTNLQYRLCVRSGQ
jgi:hypothetical protein